MTITPTDTEGRMTSSSPECKASSSPRYCYKDQLSPIWMATHFGMLFVPNIPSSIWCEDGNAGLDYLLKDIEAGLNDEPPPIYIHPDSLHLLEPQKGDVVEAIGIKGVWPIYGTVTPFVFPIESADTAIGVNSWCAPVAARDLKIIQRKGTAFMWPECEEA